MLGIFSNFNFGCLGDCKAKIKIADVLPSVEEALYGLKACGDKPSSGSQQSDHLNTEILIGKPLVQDPL